VELRDADEGDGAAVAALWTEAYAGAVVRCDERAAEFGAERVALWSRPYQVDAHRLYETLGYRRAAERDDDDRDGRRLVFCLDLDRGARVAP
jgi:hypothetical protein